MAILGRKRIPQNGIFWKSVLAKTQQAAALDRASSRIRCKTAAEAPAAPQDATTRQLPAT
jgi:hypothetical protein